MNILVPERTLWPLFDPAVAPGWLPEDAPFGLTLARPVAGTPVDAGQYTYDPDQQVLVARDGLLPVADTVRRMNTPTQTTYDHQRFSDNNPDTYRD
jgi:hypothetical protein